MVIKFDKVLFYMFLFSFLGLDGAQNTISWLLHIEELTNRNMLVSCIGYESKTNNCALSWIFQHKSCYLSLLLWRLPGFITRQKWLHRDTICQLGTKIQLRSFLFDHLSANIRRIICKCCKETQFWGAVLINFENYYH